MPNIYGHDARQRQEITREVNAISRHFRGKQYLGDIEIKAAKAYATAHEIKGDRGGWIRSNNGEGRVITQGWWNFSRLYKTKILDWLTTSLTAFPSFSAMIATPVTYRPTLMQTRDDWRYWWLAYEYDVTMAYRGDPRRVYRGD